MTPDARVGASFALSFLIVAIAAVALYRPEPATQSPAPGPRDVHSEDRGDPAPPPPTAGVAWTDPPRSGAKGEREPEPRGGLVHRVSAEAPARGAGHSSFTRVMEGESLADVARRVYGNAEAAPAIWSANRDQLERPETPLRTGSLLRTP